MLVLWDKRLLYSDKCVINYLLIKFRMLAGRETGSGPAGSLFLEKNHVKTIFNIGGYKKPLKFVGFSTFLLCHLQFHLPKYSLIIRFAF